MYELNQLIDLITKIKEKLYTNQLEEALSDIQFALRGFATLSAHEWYVRTINLRGVVYALMENEGMAVSCYLEGLQYAKEHGVTRICSILYNNIGSRYYGLGDYQQAERFYQLSEEHLAGGGVGGIINEAEYYELLTNTILNKISCNLRTKSYEKAKMNLELVEDILKKYATRRTKFMQNFFSCNYEWYAGNQETARKEIPKIVAQIKEDFFSAQGMKFVIADMVLLLKNMREDAEWFQVIEYYRENAEWLNSTSMKLTSLEYEMEYYEIARLTQKYDDCCVELFEQIEKAKEINSQERVRALNMKIELRTAEKNVQDAEGKSEHDPLTGLKNRRAMKKWIEQKIADVKSAEGQIVIGLADIDCFKMLNDTYGHTQGDRVLKEVSGVLTNCVEGMGEVFRFGGDEFVIALYGGDIAAIEEVTSCIMKRISRKKIKNENSFVDPILTMSIGYFLTKIDEGMQMDELLDKADTVLYEVKKHGRNGFRVYHSTQ